MSKPNQSQTVQVDAQEVCRCVLPRAEDLLEKVNSYQTLWAALGQVQEAFVKEPLWDQLSTHISLSLLATEGTMKSVGYWPDGWRLGPNLSVDAMLNQALKVLAAATTILRCGNLQGEERRLALQDYAKKLYPSPWLGTPPPRYVDLRYVTCPDLGAVARTLGEAVRLLRRAEAIGGETMAAEPEDAGTADSVRPATHLKEPSSDAIAAYRAHLVIGGTQTELAEILTENLGRPITQGQVSRWLKAMKDWLEAGNVLPDLSASALPKPMPMDPERIDLGLRQDGRTERQRGRRDD
ncbi:MAG TPA: hypothetical protein VMG10_14305 [Gemmataceae bacterium]|nr:hypothetical protein [Gemmataceae bacterium]